MRRLLLAEFSDIASHHADAILNTQDMLETISNLFCSGQSVYPPDFEHTIKCLMNIRENCRKFHAFIEQSGHLPLVVVPLRLPLLIALKDVDVQITKLLRLLATLSEVIWSNLYQSGEQKLEIQRELNELQVNCDEVLDQVDMLKKGLRYEIDKSKFEKRLYSVV